MALIKAFTELYSLVSRDTILSMIHHGFRYSELAEMPYDELPFGQRLLLCFTKSSRKIPKLLRSFLSFLLSLLFSR